MSPVRGLLDWVFGREQRSEITAQVKQASIELKSTALAVRERLDGYALSKDPFTAMLADVYERQQEANIWRGNEDRG